MDRNIQMYRTT